jgi:hypothetical protein
MHFASALIVAGFLVLHALAIACAWGTRVSAGSRFELAFQFAFLLALPVVGGMAWYGHLSQLGLGVPSGITLMVMVLLTVCDFRRTHEPLHPHSAASRS